MAVFNDTLALPQCEKLVHDLSRTCFPFQCAHGRPSAMPLIELPASSSHPLNDPQQQGQALSDAALPTPKEHAAARSSTAPTAAALSTLLNHAGSVPSDRKPIEWERFLSHS